MTQFKDRRDAGKSLSKGLMRYASREDVMILGLPRGGVPVAFEISRALDCPMDVFIVRKLGHPQQEELALGAIASGGVRVLNEHIVESPAIDEKIITEVTARERKELQRRERLYRGENPWPGLEGKTIILVDDGIATGATMKAAVAALRKQNVSKTIVAVPAAPPEICEELEELVDEMVCLIKPSPFLAVGQWYGDFSQTSDREVKNFLEKASLPR